MQYLMAIDQGTTSSRVFIYDEKLKVIGLGQQAFAQYFPKPGRVEHDANEIWSSVMTAMKAALRNAKDKKFSVNKIAAIGLTNQRETFLLWDKKTLRPHGRAIVWQDRRSSELCRKLSNTAAGKYIIQSTGLVLDPYFSGTKLSLLIKEIGEVDKLAFGNIDTFLLSRLTGGTVHATDVTNASRTLLLSLKQRAWDPAILKILKIPVSVLPNVLSSDAEFGKTRGLKIIPDGIPIHGILGDQQAALFGQGCLLVGQAKITYGTGAFMLVNTGTNIVRSPGSLTTIAWERKNETTYALESSVFIAGAAVQWLRDGLKIISKSSEVTELAKSVQSSDGVFFIPALAGLGAPYWIPDARGMIGGLTRGSTAGHLARATLEGIAHSVAGTFESFSKKVINKKTVVRVDGGASENTLLMQFQSDLLQLNLERPRNVETTARGAAMMAGLGCKLLPETILRKRDVAVSFTPKIPLADSRALKELWNKRVKALVELSS